MLRFAEAVTVPRCTPGHCSAQYLAYALRLAFTCVSTLGACFSGQGTLKGRQQVSKEV